ncbi:MAG: FAD-dependent oxidoreductase [Erysipelotrichaceae bacterium]|nr:FAD-dependent oxidoreductase [Erysipelotrichaceae bacterium]
MKKILILVLSVLMMLSVVACSSTTDNNSSASSTTFTGTSSGMQGPITVEMTVEDGKITNVELTEFNETASLTSVAVDRIPAQMVEYQTTTVDVVTGATFTSNAIMRAATEAAVAAGLDKETLNANAYHATAADDETWSTEIVVIGGGGAGLSAAISAAQEGAEVILIEKGSVLGGNTMMAGGAYNAVDTIAQSETILTEAQKHTLDSYLKLSTSDEKLHFEEFPEWANVLTQLQTDIKNYYTANEGKTAGVDMPGFDSISLHMWHIYVGGLRQMNDGEWIASNIELATTLAENSLESYDWAGELGVGTASKEGAGETLYTVLGAMWPRTHSYTAGQPLIDVLKTAAEKAGVTIYTETAGTTLLTEDGKVVGVIAEKADGTKITIDTSVGVIIASGGYCANPAMVKEYDEYWGDDLSATTLTTNVGTNEGDGISMAMDIGAATVDLGVAQMMPSSSPLKGTMTDAIWSDASEQIWIDGNGKRFVNEYAERDVLAKA